MTEKIVLQNLDAQQIQEYQQNRYPCFFVDKIVEAVPGEYAKGYKNFTYNEWFFPAHFEDEPNVPGFVQIETLTQVFLMTFLTFPENKGKKTGFVSVSNAKFRKKIIPGDRLDIVADLASYRRGLAKGSVKGYINNELANEVELVVSIPEIITVSVRDVYTIRPDVEPVTALPNWTWVSSDTNVAEIASSGNHLTALVTGVTPGVVTVTGTTSNGLSASCEVTVVDAPMPTGIEIEETYSLDVDETLNIKPILTPDDATTLYEVTTDNPHVVEVGTTGGHTGVTITGVNAGHATITIRGCNNVMASTVVTVGEPDDRQHEKETVPAIEATCRREGRTSYIRCSACGYRFTEPQTIPMIDHKYGEWVIVKAATDTEEGLRERYCENCGKRETDIIPALGDSGNENPGGGNSSGGGGSSTSANKNELIDVGSGSITAIVKGQEAEISATEKEISQIVHDAESSGSVELDISELSVSVASIPQNLITALHDSEAVSTLSIKTSHGSMVIDTAVLNTIANALENENDSINLGIETIDVNDIPSTQRYPIANVMNSAVFVTLSASVTHRDTNGNLLDTEQLHELGGNVTISVPYEQPANMEGRQIIACYFGENGAITYFPARYENGIVTFETSHFSQFGVFASQAAAFTDVNLDAWYMTEVEFAMANKFMSGYGDGRFAPDAPLSRAMLAQILYNMAGKPRVANCVFVDVPSGAWYYDAVTWAAANGIVGGYGNGLFGPNDPITREQLATMLYRYEQSQGGGFVNDWAFLLDYPDRDNVSGYAYEAMCWMAMNGILGDTGGNARTPRRHPKSPGCSHPGPGRSHAHALRAERGVIMKLILLLPFVILK